MSKQELTITNHSVYQNNHYLHLAVSGKTPIYGSESVLINSNKLPKKLCFPITDVAEPKLYEFIKNIEQQAEDLLLNLPDTMLAKLPVVISNRIREQRIQPWGTLLRATYRSDGASNVAWVRANENVELYDWAGGLIYHCSGLTSGDYQFIIKVATLYLGEHGKMDGVIANCVVRVSALRCRAHQQSELIWDFESDHPAKNMTDDDAYDVETTTTAVTAPTTTTPPQNCTNAQSVIAAATAGPPKKRGRKPNNALKILTSLPLPINFDESTCMEL